MPGRILWLTPKGGISKEMMFHVQIYYRRAGINPAKIVYLDLHKPVGQLTRFVGTAPNVTEIYNFEQLSYARKIIMEHVKRYNIDIIVANDYGAICSITKGTTLLSKSRGSIYNFLGTPCIAIDRWNTIFTQRHMPWVMNNDLSKLRRWAEGTQNKEPKFKYTVVESKEDLNIWYHGMMEADLLAIDIETAAGIITSIAWTALIGLDVHTWVTPLVNPLKEGNAHWETPEIEIAFWHLVKQVMKLPFIKIFQNGEYDLSYFIRYRIEVTNYLVDPLHLFHSLWIESPKSLDFISSICLDYSRFWKEELKADKAFKIFPSTPEKLARYWRYNGLDTYNTLLDAIALIRKIVSLPWALENYRQEFQQMLIGLQMQMQGLATNRTRQDLWAATWEGEYERSLATIRVMCDNPNFNPNAPNEVAELLYDTLGAEPIKSKGKKKYGARSVDKKLLALIAEKSVWHALFIDMINATKEPRNNNSKYGSQHELLWPITDRLAFSQNAAGTDTSRWSSSHHPFWFGTNAQNIPVDIRDMWVADEGMVRVDFDYSQSDMWYVAYQCEDEKMIEIMNSDLDKHCYHAAQFFNRTYEEILAGKIAEEEWVIHPTKGVRNINKRVVHGGNYQMAAFTLYGLIGRNVTVAGALAAGFNDTHTWGQKQCVEFIDQVLFTRYYNLYPGLKKWFRTSIQEAAKNGNLVTNGYGHTKLFFGDILVNPDIQREISAYYGQAGTAGNINRSLREIQYKQQLWKEGLRLELQVHDSIVCQMPIEKMHTLTGKVLTIMQAPVTIRGRTFQVPVEAKIGFSWGSNLKYKPSLTYEDLIAAEQKVEMKYAKMRAKLLAE